MIIDISITNKIASLADEAAFIVCGNSDYVINFTFTDEWSKYNDKTARFIFGGKHIDITFSGNSCAAPIISNTREVFVGVIAGELSTTTPARIECKKSVACDDIAGTETKGIIPINSSHTHENKWTLNDFHCVASELEADNEFPIVPNYVGVDRPTFRGNYLRYCTDGGVVKRVEEKEESGDKFLRLWFDKGILDTSLSVPDFIDVPVRTVTEKIEEIAGVGLSTNSTGLELELPTGGADGEGGIPAVHTLPTDAKEGDLFLYAPQNTLTLADSGKRIYFDWEKCRKIIELANDPDFYYASIFYNVSDSKGDSLFQISGIYADGDCVLGMTIFFEDGSVKEQLVAYFMENGEETCRGYYEFAENIGAEPTRIDFDSIDEFPHYFNLPEFDKDECVLEGEYFYNDDEAISPSDSPVYYFHTEYKLMKYQGGEWVEAVKSGVTQSEMQEYVTAAINGSLDEIEAMIDESGVLTE